MPCSKFLFLVFFLLLLVFSGCRNSNNTKKDLDIHAEESFPQSVEVIVIERANFHQQIISNGLLTSHRKAGLRFQTSGIIRDVNVNNGKLVKKGEILAVLDNKEHRISLEQASEQIVAAELELQNLLLSSGGKADDSSSISEELYNNLKIQSGYSQAVNNYKKAKLEYENTFLKAPFSGVVADLNFQNFNYITSSDVFCVLLDNSSFTVDFQIIESEVGRVRKGQDVVVFPYFSDNYELSGTITEINPTVDRNGLIKINATLNEKADVSSFLFDGMKVKVIITNSIPGQLIIPKEAVVLRSGKNVVFTYENGLSKWNYVNIEHENSTHYGISGIYPGDTVIVEGNLNLATDARVSIKDKRKDSR